MRKKTSAVKSETQFSRGEVEFGEIGALQSYS